MAGNIPEPDWTLNHPQIQVSLKVQTKTLPLTLNSALTVLELKESVSQFFEGAPSSVQILKDKAPLRDAMTLAYFNVGDGAVLELV